MAAISTIQNSFTAGELDPKLRARNDIASYYNGAQKLRNVLCTPQGGVIRRPGLEYITTLPLSNLRIFEFAYTKSLHYIVILSHLKAEIYKFGQYITEVATVITDSQLPEITMAQSYDTMLFFHNEFPPVYLLREDELSWESDYWHLLNIPTHNFTQAETVRVLSVTDTTTTDDIDFANWVDGSTYSNVTFTLDSPGGFVSKDEGRYIRTGLGGYARIETVISGTVATGTILAPFTNDLEDGSTSIEAGEWWKEDEVFSADMGYPACGAFYQGRLWLAATPTLPNGIWASKVNDEEDFGNWIPSFDDNGIFIVARDTRTPFHMAFSGKHIMFFSTDGVFFVAKSDTEPVTPTNVALQKSSSLGSKPNTPPYEISGSVIYLRNGGKSILESTYTFANGAYDTKDLSLLASHLISNPKAIAYRRQTSTDESDYMLLVNSDGTLSVLCTLKAQEVTAWTVCQTEGKFYDVAVDDTEMYFIIDRTINGAPKRFLERFNRSLLVDCGVINPGTPITFEGVQLTFENIDLTFTPNTVTSVSGLSHLIGEEVQIVLDNTIQEPQTVTSDTITLARPGNDVNVGLNFPIVDDETGYNVLVKSMPIEPQTQYGSMVGKKKRLSAVTAMIYETSHLIINSNKGVIRKIGIDKLDSPVPKRTENLKVSGILGWDDEIEVTVGQTLPLPFTLLGISYRVRY